MAKSPDLLLLRAAVKAKALSAVEAEDCWFLKKKFGDKYTLVEIVRRRGYDVKAVEALALELELEREEARAPVHRTRFFRPPPRAGAPIDRPPISAIPEKEEAAPPRIGEESAEVTVLLTPEAIAELRRKHAAEAAGQRVERERASMPPPAVVPDAGFSFGPYTILRTLGRHRTGVVYVARHADGREVALRVLDQELARSADYVQRFRRGVEIAMRVDSPHVERFLDHGEIGGVHYQALEYVDGWTVRERLIASGQLELAETLRVARDLCTAIDALEGARLVHRNIKPDTILILGDDRAVLTDLGLAKEIDAGDARTGVVGTPNYIAPEQAAGGEIDQRADLYSLGATIFELIMGRPPQTSPSPTSPLVRNLSGLEDKAPPRVAALVTRLLALDPNGRFLHASEVAAEIDALMLAERDQIQVVHTAPRQVPSMLVAAVATTVTAIAFEVAARAAGWPAPRSPTRFLSALLGSLSVTSALLLFPLVALLRIGQLPLPGSTAWMVRLKDLAGLAGTTFLMAGIFVGPASFLNLLISVMGALALGSWQYGILIRREVAAHRADGGVGRMLALLAEPELIRWRLVHVPLVAILSFLALIHVVLLTYFRTSRGS